MLTERQASGIAPVVRAATASSRRSSTYARRGWLGGRAQCDEEEEEGAGLNAAPAWFHRACERRSWAPQIVKATVGAGSFVLPFCMRQMGLIPGILTIILLGAVCVYTTLMLVRTKNMLYQATGKLDITYVDIGTAPAAAAQRRTAA